MDEKHVPKLLVNIFDAANEEVLDFGQLIEWPTGATLPLVGEQLRVHGHGDLQVVRRLFHIGLLVDDLIVDLFVGYVIDE